LPQAVWTGQLSFGLVNIPVKLYGATAPRSVQFHHYDAQTGRRIRYRRVATGPPLEEPGSIERESSDPTGREQSAPSSPVDRAPEPEPRQRTPVPDSTDEEEVPWEEIVKGFEIEPGRVVTVTPDELVSLAPERSRLLEVEQFVDLEAIDPVHFEKSYYVVPQPGQGAERPYRLLYRAMEDASQVAVGRFVMRTKEYLAVVRPGEHLLMLETLFYEDEVRDPKQFWVPPAQEPTERELRVARQLIQTLAGEWEPARHRDSYRERVLDLLRSKVGEERVLPERDDEELPGPAIDLMEALKASVDAAKEARAAQRKQTG
jgi:DNA end-binding protein Ku